MRVHIDFKDRKDEYPMHMVDLLIDSAINHEVLSFMDGHLDISKILLLKKTFVKMR